MPFIVAISFLIWSILHSDLWCLYNKKFGMISTINLLKCLAEFYLYQVKSKYFTLENRIEPQSDTVFNMCYLI